MLTRFLLFPNLFGFALLRQFGSIFLRRSGVLSCECKILVLVYIRKVFFLGQRIPSVLSSFLLGNLGVISCNFGFVQLDIFLNCQMISNSFLWHVFDQLAPIVKVNFFRPFCFRGDILTENDGVSKVIDNHIQIRNFLDDDIGPLFDYLSDSVEHFFLSLGVNSILLVHIPGA